MHTDPGGLRFSRPAPNNRQRGRNICCTTTKVDNNNNKCTTIALVFLASAVASLAENTDGIFIRNGRPFAKLDSGAIQGQDCSWYRGILSWYPLCITAGWVPAFSKASTTGKMEWYEGDGERWRRLPTTVQVTTRLPTLLTIICLYLQFLPQQNRRRISIPVMFWIHGGDFYQGYGGVIM